MEKETDSTKGCHTDEKVSLHVDLTDVSKVSSTADAFKPDMITDNINFHELSKRFSALEKHCISLEIALQQRQETVQPTVNHEYPELREFFEINNLKAQLEDKTRTINTLKAHINSLNADNSHEN